MTVVWEDQAHPRVLVVHGAKTSQEIDTETMVGADVVACVAADGVRIVKHRQGLTRGMPSEEWPAELRRQISGQPKAQVQHVGASTVRGVVA